MSFIKMREVADLNGAPLHWGRVDEDAAPYKGPPPQFLKNSEAHHLQRAYDVFYGTFDTSNPEQEIAGHTLQAVLDRVANNWYTMVSFNERWGERDGVPVMFTFVIWRVPYMQADKNSIPKAFGA